MVCPSSLAVGRVPATPVAASPTPSRHGFAGADGVSARHGSPDARRPRRSPRHIRRRNSPVPAAAALPAGKVMARKRLVPRACRLDIRAVPRWFLPAILCIALSGILGIAITREHGRSSHAQTLPAVVPVSSAESSGAPAPTATPSAPIPTPVPLQPAAGAAPPVRSGDAQSPEVAAHAAVVIDGASAEVLYDKAAHESLPPASLTKIMTAILVIERIPTETVVEVDVDSRKMTGSSVMGLVPGDHYSVYNLLYGLMLPSGNDAALALARAVSGSDSAFVAEMNAFARNLGLKDTHFVNPHGLSSRQQYASAYDLAILARFGMSLPTFSDIVSTPGALIDGSRPMALYNGNSFLRAYDGADGVKIGYTNSAGYTLVASATRNGHRLFAVVLNSTQRDADAAALLDWAFASYAWPAP